MTSRLDMTDTATQAAFAELEEACRTMAGINFALLMRGEDGTFTVYKRPNQPCQGGEMRKYKSSHREDCTRPSDHRPGDLRMPFPKGTPEAVGIHLNSSYHGQSNQDDLIAYIDAVYGPTSPYLKGFGSPEAVLKVKDKKENVVGIIFTDTEVDSTVLVNLLQYFRRGGNPAALKFCTGLGFTVQETLVIMYLNSHMNVHKDKIHIGNTYPYYFSTNASLRRLFEQDPYDLTGGTFRDRFDYNRPDVQDLFKARDNEIGMVWNNEFNKEFKTLTGKEMHETDDNWNTTYNVTPDLFVQTVNILFDKYYRSNKGIETVVKKDIKKVASGDAKKLKKAA